MSALLTPARREFLVSAARYGLAGVINTLVGLTLILALDVGLGVDPHIANAVGYAVGVCVSFALSRLFVFKARRPARSAPLRYAAAVAVAFTLNQGVLTLVRLVLPPGTLFDVAAQGAAVASYTATLFLLSHFWVFAHHPPADRDSAWTA